MKEQQFFIRLLGDFICGRTSADPEEDMNWDLIIQYAEEQNLAGIIYFQCRVMKSLDKAVIRKLNKGFLSDAYLAVNGEYAFSEIKSRFDRENIPYLPFKGAVFRKYYPYPELRTMGDQDILIRHEDRKRSDVIMKDLGYSKLVDNHAVWTYHKPLLVFEIHDVMFYEELSNQTDYRGYFSKVWETAVGKGTSKPAEAKKDSFEYIPESNLHFLYTIAHTAKHVINNGMGFRAFLDMAFFSRNAGKVDGKEPDWEWITRELKKLQLYNFTATCFRLCENWFGVEMPFRNESIDPAFIEKVTEKIFRDGIFGLINEDNAGAHSAKEIKRSDASYRKTAWRLTVSKLFPPYEDMQLIPWYQWVDGKPWLLPAAWIYRWGYCLIHKSKHGKELLLEPYQKRKKIEEREVYLENWGL